MRHLTTILFTFPVILSMLFSSCSEKEDIGVEPSDVQDVETLTTPPPIETDPEKAFYQFRERFAGRLENHGNFTGLREITTSEIYLDYLAAVYPTETPVSSLEEYFQTAAPDPERYIPFLVELGIDEPTDADIAVIHRMTRIYRENDYTRLKMLVEEQALVQNVALIFEKVMDVMTEPAVEAFLERYDLEINSKFSAQFEQFVDDTLIEDGLWLQQPIKKYGIDNGLLWGALQNPAFIGEILLNFDATDTFLFWLNEGLRIKQL